MFRDFLPWMVLTSLNSTDILLLQELHRFCPLERCQNPCLAWHLEEIPPSVERGQSQLVHTLKQPHYINFISMIWISVRMSAATCEIATFLHFCFNPCFDYVSHSEGPSQTTESLPWTFVPSSGCANFELALLSSHNGKTWISPVNDDRFYFFYIQNEDETLYLTIGRTLHFFT